MSALEKLGKAANILSDTKESKLDVLSRKLSEAKDQKKLAKVLKPLFDSLIKFVKDIAKSLEKDTNKKVDTAVAQLNKATSQVNSALSMARNIESVSENVANKTSNQLRREIETIVQDIRKEIPNLPEPFDPSYLERQIGDLDFKTRNFVTNGELKESVSELTKTLEEMKKEIVKVSKMKRIENSGGVRRIFQPYIDRFTSETDGATKTFYLSREPTRTSTVEVSGTDFPIILDPTVDFTVSGKAVTLTSQVPAPSAGSTLIIKYYA